MPWASQMLLETAWSAKQTRLNRDSLADINISLYHLVDIGAGHDVLKAQPVQAGLAQPGVLL